MEFYFNSSYPEVTELYWVDLNDECNLLCKILIHIYHYNLSFNAFPPLQKEPAQDGNKKGPGSIHPYIWTLILILFVQHAC